MATTTEPSDGIVLDSELIVRTVKYYGIIGAGLGLLGIVFLSQFLGGSDGGGTIVGGILTIVVLAFAFLSGPLVAALIGFTTPAGEDRLKQRAINSGIANGVGFAVYGTIVFILLALGMALFLSGGGGAETGAASSGGGGGGDSSTPMGVIDFISILVVMAIPNALVGGGITYFLGNQPSQRVP